MDNLVLINWYEKKYKEAMRALESLTPSGSEYVGDPKNKTLTLQNPEQVFGNAKVYGDKQL